MKLIKEYSIPIVWVVLFSFLMIMMTKHFHHIAVSNEPLDEERGMISQMKSFIPSGSQASFTTNLRDDESSQGAYYQTQFCLCPMVLSDNVSSNGYIISYRSSLAPDSDIAALHQCDTLCRQSGSSYTLLLLCKSKKQ